MVEESPQITVVFTSELTQALSEHRLPPAYVGVRRVRPSATVAAALQSQSSVRSAVTFTVPDPETGLERRMSRQEKKQLKCKIRQEHILEKKQRKEQQRKEEEEEANTTASASETTKKRKRVSIPDFLKGDQYYNLPINVAALEQELADLAGERNRVPPVAVGPPMTRLLLNHQPLPIVVDHDLAQSWAVALKESMKDAEIVRQAEDMRAMVYDVVPSVWTRMRPESLGSSQSSSLRLKDEDSYNTFPLGASSSRVDVERAAVIQALHCGTNLHVSCGAKFGGDYLIYEAPRDECHAFAGLRVLSSSGTTTTTTTTTDLPLPTAYDMTGYVRCLHTAAKLALLAMVQERTIEGTLVYHVAFVELALIKIGSTHRR